MALLLLSLGLSLASAQELNLNPSTVAYWNFNIARLSGSWYSISMAADNLTRIEENGDLRVFIRTIDPKQNGSLGFNFRFMLHGECVIVAVVCNKTQKSGEFSITYEGENKVILLETDYTAYSIFQLKNTKDSVETRVLALYGRIPVLSDSFLKRFKEICKILRVNPRNIIDLTEQDHCYLDR